MSVTLQIDWKNGGRYRMTEDASYGAYVEVVPLSDGSVHARVEFLGRIGFNAAGHCIPFWLSQAKRVEIWEE